MENVKVEQRQKRTTKNKEQGRFRRSMFSVKFETRNVFIPCSLFFVLNYSLAAFGFSCSCFFQFAFKLSNLFFLTVNCF